MRFEMQPVVLQPVGLHGLVAPFAVSSDPKGRWHNPSELVRLHLYRDCFAGCLERVRAGSQHVALLVEHDWKRQIATTRDRSLVLEQTNDGLMFFAHGAAVVREASRVPHWRMSFCGTPEPNGSANRWLSDGTMLEISWSYFLVEISLVAKPLFGESWALPLY